MPLRYRAKGNDPALRSFMCPDLHGAVNPGRAMIYLIKERSIKDGRYAFLD
jgi:plastocyanin domain-containing protein